MSLPHALLGLINYYPATGYDLKNRFHESIHFFWNATLPQIYRTLNQMEAQGWVESAVEHQNGKPSKKVYRITGAGRGEFLRWLAETYEEPERRMATLVKVFFGNQLSREEFLAQVQAWRSLHLKLLEQYEREIPPAIDRYSSMTGLSREAPFWRMTFDFGMRHVRMTIEWCDAVIEGLAKDQGLTSSPSGRPSE